jgi:hypothetical protein
MMSQRALAIVQSVSSFLLEVQIASQSGLLCAACADAIRAYACGDACAFGCAAVRGRIAEGSRAVDHPNRGLGWRGEFLTAS